MWLELKESNDCFVWSLSSRLTRNNSTQLIQHRNAAFFLYLQIRLNCSMTHKYACGLVMPKYSTSKPLQYNISYDCLHHIWNWLTAIISFISSLNVVIRCLWNIFWSFVNLMISTNKPALQLCNQTSKNCILLRKLTQVWQNTIAFQSYSALHLPKQHLLSSYMRKSINKIRISTVKILRYMAS